KRKKAADRGRSLEEKQRDETRCMKLETQNLKPETLNPEPRQRGKSLFSFCAFHFIDDGFADSIYLLLPFIAAELHLSFSEVGLLKGVFSGAMGLFQVPMSLLGERIGELTVIAS